jgi:hypothetical protein
LIGSTNREEVKKGLILQFFVGAFPELTNIIEHQKNGFVNEYNLMIDLDNTIDFGVEHNKLKQHGGSKKKKQVHKKKSKKSRML